MDHYRVRGLSPSPQRFTVSRYSPVTDTSDSLSDCNIARYYTSVHTRRQLTKIRGYQSDGAERKPNSLPPIGVFWDIENCQIPHGKSALSVVQAVRNKFFDGYREVEFLVVCDVKKESNQIIQELNNAQVNCMHVCSQSKNAADDKLKQAMQRFADTHSFPSALILISSDVNFASDLSDLRHRKKIHIILLHSSNCSDTLIACANEHYNFGDLVIPLPLRAPAQSQEQRTELIISNLPLGCDLKKIKQRLKCLSQNCGGKIKHLDVSYAIMTFPTTNLAARAHKRMRGEDVYGKQIIAEYPPTSGISDLQNGFSSKSSAFSKTLKSKTYNSHWNDENCSNYFSDPPLEIVLYGEQENVTSNHSNVVCKKLMTQNGREWPIEEISEQSLAFEKFRANSRFCNPKVNTDLVEPVAMVKTEPLYESNQEETKPLLETLPIVQSKTRPTSRMAAKLTGSPVDQRAKQAPLKEIFNSPKLQNPNELEKNSVISSPKADILNSSHKNNPSAFSSPKIDGSTNSSPKTVENIKVKRFCAKHDTDDNLTQLPNVVISLKKFSNNVLRLLYSHKNCLPLKSFYKCYTKEFGDLEISEAGVPLEYLVTCVNYVSLSELNDVRYLEPCLKSLIDEEKDENSSSANSQLPSQLISLSREVDDLLKSKWKAQIEFEQFVSHFQHFHGKHCRLADYGFSRLLSLLKALPNVQVLGEGKNKIVTLKHQAQVERFCTDLLKVLNIPQYNLLHVIKRSQFDDLYQKCFLKYFDPYDYGLCFLDDLLSCVSNKILVIPSKDDQFICRKEDVGDIFIVTSQTQKGTFPSPDDWTIFGGNDAAIKRVIPLTNCVDRTSLPKMLKYDTRELDKDCAVPSEKNNIQQGNDKILPSQNVTQLPISGDILNLFTPEKLVNTDLPKLLNSDNQESDKDECFKVPLPVKDQIDKMKSYCIIHDKHNNTSESKGGTVELPCVVVRLMTFASHVHKLLDSHENVIPLKSFYKCYMSEFGHLEISEQNGVPLEHLITCVNYVNISETNDVKYVTRTETKNVYSCPLHLDSYFGRVSRSYDVNVRLPLTKDEHASLPKKSWSNRRFRSLMPGIPGLMADLSSEVFILLKGHPRAQIPFEQFTPLYHQIFGKQYRLADYGFNRLISLLKALPDVQILGEGSNKMITMTHQEQMRRFFLNLLRVLKSQPLCRILLSQLPKAFLEILSEPLDPLDYGVCFIDDLLNFVSSTIQISPVQGDVLISYHLTFCSEVEISLLTY